MYTPIMYNLPLLCFIWLAHKLIRAFFVFAVRLSLAHFYPSRQSALRVPGFVCARHSKKGELKSSCGSGMTKVHGAEYILSTFIVIFWNLSRRFLVFKKTSHQQFNRRSFPVSLCKRIETNPHNEIIISPNFVFLCVVHGRFHQNRLTFVI